MLPTEIGALMRYADDLVDCRALPAAAPTILNRLVFRYRARGAPAACVGLDELAGDGMAKGTVIRLLRALERAGIVFKEKCGKVVNGRWRQTANRYWLRTAEQAKAAAIAEATEAAEEVEIAFVTPSESNSWTANGVFLEEKESKEESLFIQPVDNAPAEEVATESQEGEAEVSRTPIKGPLDKLLVQAYAGQRERPHAPTLWDIAAEHPGMVRVVPDDQNKHYAEVRAPYSPDNARLLRSCPGAFWLSARKVWRVPAYGARRLSEALYVISSRSR
jgi:hypothetical protein